MDRIINLEYLKKEQENFADECNKILDALAPSINPQIKRIIISKIGLVRVKMEFVYTKDLMIDFENKTIDGLERIKQQWIQE